MSSRRWVVRSLVVLVLITASVVTQRVSACSCAEILETTPASGQRVPRNAKLWLPPKLVHFTWLLDLAARGSEDRRDLPSDAELAALLIVQDPAQQELPFRIEVHEFGREVGRFFAVVPDQEFRSGPHLLRLREPRTFEGDDVPPLQLPFFVTEERVETPPRPPSARVQDWILDDDAGMCGPFRAVTLRVDRAGWLAKYKIQDPAKRTFVGTGTIVGDDSPLWFGDGACIPFWSANRPALISFQTMDVTGQTSEWSQPLRLEPPEQLKSARRFENRFGSRGCGCGQVRSDHLGGFFCLLALGLLSRRSFAPRGGAARPPDRRSSRRRDS